jgi:hypothetical protein
MPKKRRGLLDAFVGDDDAPASPNVTPASIRFSNPGAMWPGPVATRYGATGSQNLADGNKIAVFADPVSGAAAQFGLLNSKYMGMPLRAAIRKWSGGNSSDAYAASIAKATGLNLDDPLTANVLSDPNVAIPLARASAHWEAGRDYPLSDEDWNSAFERANGGGGSTRIALGGPQNGGDQPMAGLFNAGANMAKFLPSPVTTGSVPSTPDTPSPAPGLFGGGDQDAISKLLTSPMFQFGLGVMNAGTQGKGVGSGLFEGARNAPEALKLPSTSENCRPCSSATPSSKVSMILTIRWLARSLRRQ